MRATFIHRTYPLSLVLIFLQYYLASYDLRKWLRPSALKNYINTWHMYVSTNTQQPFVAAVWKCLSLADVYMYVCTHTYIRIYLYILYIFIYVYKHTYMYIHTYTYTHIFAYIYTRIYEDCSRFSGPTFVYRHCSLNKDITFFFFFLHLFVLEGNSYTSCIYQKVCVQHDASMYRHTFRYFTTSVVFKV